MSQKGRVKARPGFVSLTTTVRPIPGVVPAKAGTQLTTREGGLLGPSFRWDEIRRSGNLAAPPTSGGAR